MKPSSSWQWIPFTPQMEPPPICTPTGHHRKEGKWTSASKPNAVVSHWLHSRYNHSFETYANKPQLSLPQTSSLLPSTSLPVIRSSPNNFEQHIIFLHTANPATILGAFSILASPPLSFPNFPQTASVQLQVLSPRARACMSLQSLNSQIFI